MVVLAHATPCPPKRGKPALQALFKMMAIIFYHKHTRVFLRAFVSLWHIIPNYSNPEGVTLFNKTISTGKPVDNEVVIAPYQ